MVARRPRPSRRSWPPSCSFPLGVYLLSYGAFFYQHGFAVHDFLTLQLAMLRYQEAHVAIQPENSLPWTWPLLLHPVRYLHEVRDGASSVVVALGNPALWWGFLLLLPVALVQIVRRPTWQDAVVFGGYAAMFLPWFVVGRTQFIWYMLPAVPFMCLGVAATIRRLPATLAKVLAIGFGATPLVALAFMPVWTAWWIPNGLARTARLASRLAALNAPETREGAVRRPPFSPVLVRAGLRPARRPLQLPSGRRMRCRELSGPYFVPARRGCRRCRSRCSKPT